MAHMLYLVTILSYKVLTMLISFCSIYVYEDKYDPMREMEVR